MAQYATKKCPHCEYAYSIHQFANMTSWGSPVRTCPRCHKQFIDTSYKEMAIEGFDEEPKKVTGSTIFLLVMGLLVLGGSLWMVSVYSRGDDAATMLMCVAVGLFFTGVGVYGIIADIMDHEERKQWVEKERQASWERCNDINYLNFLQTIGVKIPSSLINSAGQQAKKVQVDKPMQKESSFIETEVEEKIYNSEKRSQTDIPKKLFCNNCGREVPLDSLFCPFCGKDLRDIKRLGEPDKRIKHEVIKEQIKPPRISKKVVSLIIIVIVALLIFVFCLFRTGVISHKKNTTASTASTPAKESTASPSSTVTPITKAPTKTPVTETPKKDTVYPPLTMPINEKIFYCAEEDTPSLFTVRNNGISNYYIKFVYEGTDTPAIIFFVRAKSTAEIKMPAGRFELRYAYGGSPWYGEKILFGEETRYAKDDDVYDFSQYTWEVSLYTTDGKGIEMDVENIDADEF